MKMSLKCLKPRSGKKTLKTKLTFIFNLHVLLYSCNKCKVKKPTSTHSNSPLSKQVSCVEKLPVLHLPWCSRWRPRVAWRRSAAAASARKTKAVLRWSSVWSTASAWTPGRHGRIRRWPDRRAGTACCFRRCSSSQPLGPEPSGNSCQAPRQLGKWKRGGGRVHLDKVTASARERGTTEVRS